MNYISDDINKGKNVKIGKGTVIENNVDIGSNVRIGHNVTIQENVHIGKETIIGNNVVLGERTAKYYEDPENHDPLSLTIGNNCIIRSGSVLYEGSKFGDYFQTGANVSIRERNYFGRGSMFGTLCQSECDIQVGDYSRIINGVELGKEAVIGKFVWIFAFATLTDDPHPPCGKCKKSATIDDYALIGPHVVLMPHVHIGKASIIGAGSVVTKDMPPEQVCIGTPARPVKSIYDLKCTIVEMGKPLVEEPYPWIKNVVIMKKKVDRYHYKFDDIKDDLA